MRLALLFCFCALARADTTELEKRLAELEQQVQHDRAKIARLESAQLEREVEGYLERTDGGEMPGPTTGYDNEFFLRSRDGRYRLALGLYTQVRYDVNGRDDALDGYDRTEAGWGFGTTELYLRAKMTDRIEAEFRFDFNDGAGVEIIEAYLRWTTAGGWNILVGQQFIANSRESWMFAQDTLAAEFSANAEVFGLKSSLGVQVFRQGRRHRGWIAFSQGRDAVRAGFNEPPNAEWALSGRWEWQIAGEDWDAWEDLIGRRGRPFGVLLGLSPLFEGGVENAEYTRAALFTADLSVSGDGYQAMLAVTLAHSLQTASPDESNATTWGVLAQGGWFFTERWQLWVQYDGVFAGDREGYGNFNAAGIGVNFFPIPATNRQKFTLEFKYLFDALNETLVAPSPDLGWLPSDEAGQFLLRLQLQFGF